MDDTGGRLLQSLSLKEYEATALNKLLELGRTTAPNLAEATGIPKARIYDVLESLGEYGYVKIIPGRPKEYQPKSPEEILERAQENRRQRYEDYCQDVEELREEFIEHYEPLYETSTDSTRPADELFYVVDVGDLSIRETRQIYRGAEETLHIMTKSLEYIDQIEPALRAVVEDGLDVQLLFLHPEHLSEENHEIQQGVRERIDSEFPDLKYRFSKQPMPWRGTLADPSMDYETGKAIFLVEEKDVPLHMRQAAVTENGSFVAGMDRYFTLIWQYDSLPAPE